MSSIQSFRVGGTSYGIEANKLGSPASIDGVAFDGGDSIVHYATSSTGASTAAKAATIGNDFTLGTGARVTVKFTNANTAANPTLNVNSTGAKSIMAYGTTNAVTWDAGQAVEFVYDGTYWQMISSGVGSATIRGRVKVDANPTSGSDNAVSSGGVYTKLAAKAPLASPALTGTPTAPTPAAGDSSTKIATTAFVSSAISALGIDEVNRRVLEAFPTETSTGAVSETLNGADNIPPKSVEVTMLPIQNLNGYDNPWPGGGGVNKIDFSSCTSGYSNDGLHCQLDGELIEFAGIYEGTGTSTFQVAKINDDQKTLASTLSFAGFVTSVTSPGGSVDVRVTSVSYFPNSGYFEATITNLFPTISYDFHIGIVAYSGTAPTAWSPYINYCPISGRTGASVYFEDEYDANADPFATFDWTSAAGTVYGATLSDNHNGTWTLARNWDYAEANSSGQLVFPLSGTTVNVAGNTGNNGYAYYNVPDESKPYKTSVGNGICNLLKTAPITTLSETECFFSYQTSGKDGRLGFRLMMLPGWNQGTGAQNGALFSAWVQDQYAEGRILQAAWKLVTPVTYTLSAESVKSYLAKNAFWSPAGDSTVIWRCDPTLFINSQVAALTALISGT